MRGPAERQSDASREPGATPGREPESATFAVVRVGSRGLWPSLAVAGLVIVLALMIGAAVGSQDPSQPNGNRPVAAASSRAAAGPTATPTPPPTSAPRRLPPPTRTSDPTFTKIRLDAERQPSSIFVHGDVYVPNVTWVFVSLQDTRGNVAGWASVSVPGAAGPAVGSGPTLRFDVEVAVPAAFSGPLSIQANAYDPTGRIIGSTGLVMDPEPTP